MQVRCFEPCTLFNSPLQVHSYIPIFTAFSMYAQAATIRAVSPDALEISYKRIVTDKDPSQSTARRQQPGPSFAARAGRGHIPQLSISDDNHHVTEAIGGMYDDDEEHDSRRSLSPLNYASPTTNGGPVIRQPLPERSSARGSLSRKQVPRRNISNGGSQQDVNDQSRPSYGRAESWEQENGHTSPTLGLRERAPSDTATTHFPLADIDYESSPAAVAQELSNLHALRRMSMDVAAQGDPDLPSLSPAGMPSAPSHSDSEDDSARLFWVPARLHPELAPQEFKSFLNSKAEQIKRRSGELSQFSSSPSSSRSSSLSVQGGGLQRKKSMLSRQIDSPVGYQDGSERLERKRSLSSRNGHLDPHLEELESLVSEGSTLQRLSIESPTSGENGDIILPSVPGNSLKRSTRTTYNRGGSRKGRGDRTTYAQRAARRTAAGGDQVSPQSPQVSDVPPLPSFSPEIANLANTLKDPSANSMKTTTNFSRPGRSPSPPQSLSGSSFGTTFDDVFGKDDGAGRSSISSLPSTFDRKTSSNYQDRLSHNLPRDRHEIPQIIEVPPPEEPLSRPSTAPAQPPQSYMQNTTSLPERKSSREPARDDSMTPPPARPGMPPRQAASVISHKRPPSRGGNVTGGPSQGRPGQSLEQMSSHPSPLPGNDTNTGNLSFIPTLTEDKRADNRKIKDKKEDGKKSGWGWLLGKEDAEKDKKTEGGGSKPKAKITKAPEKHDNTRLDVLQSSIDAGSGKTRESLVLDRDGLKLEEERKKESQRKSAGSDMKKEREGIFSSLFGGKKGKGEKESTTRKHHSRGLSPEPPYRELKPDIDYNWTRFSILEERAIYRMAHIKLANPRRALYSQVLLSNFMYSYLAKVQQMHPQMNLPTSAKAQKKQQQQPKQQPDEFTQYQMYQQV
jgi:Activator of mitotic machinery Cdc14 phosphatase activation C-term